MVHVPKAKKVHKFDPNVFLATIGEGRKIVAVPKKSSHKGIPRTLSSIYKKAKCGSPLSPRPARKQPSVL